MEQTLIVSLEIFIAVFLRNEHYIFSILLKKKLQVLQF